MTENYSSREERRKQQEAAKQKRNSNKKKKSEIERLLFQEIITCNRSPRSDCYY